MVAKGKERERRKHKRHTVEQKAAYAPLDVFHKPVYHESVALDISEAGVSFYSENNYKIGDMVLVSVYLPGWEKEKTGFIKPASKSSFEPLNVLVKVCWIAKAGNRYKVGSEFVNIDPEHQKALVKFLNKMVDE